MEKFWRISLYVFDWWCYCKALCDEAALPESVHAGSQTFVRLNADDLAISSWIRLQWTLPSHAGTTTRAVMLLLPVSLRIMWPASLTGGHQ